MSPKKPSKAELLPNVSVASSVSEFVDRLNLLPHADNIIRTFRGEANKSWQFKPGVMRKGREKLLAHEKDSVREIVSVHPDHFLTDLTMFDRLVRMQHFGLPTRLLDVTGNPLVALFNASAMSLNPDGSQADGRVFYLRVPLGRHKYFDSDTVSCVANLANLTVPEKETLIYNQDIARDLFNNPKKVPAADKLLQFIRAEKPSFRPLISPSELNGVWYVVPKMSNRRIIAQNGAFLIFGLSDDIMEPSVGGGFSSHRITIPASAKPKIRVDLALLGVTESSLFPEIDKAAAQIIQKFSS